MGNGEEALLAFYSGAGADDRGRRLSEILSWGDRELEAVHDYIQWVFPLPEPSGVNRSAPLLTERVRAEFAASAAMRARMRGAWLRMLQFYGLVVDADGRVGKGDWFAARAEVWLTPYNHNHLRLTRMLRCLGLAGLGGESAALYAALLAIVAEDERVGVRRISEETVGYWKRAAE